MRKWVIFVGLVCGALNGGNANARLPDSLALSVPAETGFTLDRLWSSMDSRVETVWDVLQPERSEEHTSELQSLMRISYAVFCLKKKKTQTNIKRKYKKD